jgi:hypothetical protein
VLCIQLHWQAHTQGCHKLLSGLQQQQQIFTLLWLLVGQLQGQVGLLKFSVKLLLGL